MIFLIPSTSLCVIHPYFPINIFIEIEREKEKLMRFFCEYLQTNQPFIGMGEWDGSAINTSQTAFLFGLPHTWRYIQKIYCNECNLRLFLNSLVIASPFFATKFLEWNFRFLNCEIAVSRWIMVNYSVIIIKLITESWFQLIWQF